MKLRNTVPLLLMTILAVPAATPIGMTKLICDGELPTKYKPAAAPFTDTETPLNSTGRKGERVVSETPLAFTFAGASGAVPRMIPNSPGASPAAVPGEGLGVGVGLGLGLGLGFGVTVGTGMLLAPVKNVSVADG